MAIGSFILKYNYKDALKISIRDRKNHKSPNCAYPEGAVAGALGIQFRWNKYILWKSSIQTDYRR